MAWKSNELLGASQKLLDILRTPADAALLTSGGLTVPTVESVVDARKTTYSTAEHDQEEAAQRAKDLAKAEQTAGQTLYDTITSAIDAAAGAAGKKSALGKRLLAIRKQLNRSKSKGSSDSGSGSGSGSGSASGSGSGSASGSGS